MHNNFKDNNFMPYARNIDIPGSILQGLPEPAHDTYRAAFNKALIYYGGKKKTNSPGLEEVAHSVAWASLEQNFHKAGNRWVAD